MSRIWKSHTIGGSTFNVALEEFDNLENPISGEVLGDVDEAVELAAIQQESSEVSTEVDAAQAALNSHDNGEEVAQMADAVSASGEVTPGVAGLTQTAVGEVVNTISGDQDVADDAAEQVAQESAGKFTIATEGFKDVLKAAWTKIVEFVKGIIRRVKDAWNRFWNSTAKLVKKAKELKENAQGRDGKANKDEVEVSSSIANALALTSSARFDAANVVKHVGEFFKDVAGKVNGTEAEVKATTTGLKAVFDSLATDAVKNADSVDKKEEEAVKVQLNKFIDGGNSSAVISAELGKNFVGSADTLAFGNKAYVKAYNGKPDATVSEKMNSFTCKLVNANPSSSWKVTGKDGLKTDTLSLSDIIKLADAVVEFGNSIEKFYNTGSKKVQDAINTFEKDVDKATKDIDDGANMAARKIAKDYQRAYILPTQLLRGNMDLSVFGIKTGYQVVALGNKMVAQYDKKDKK